MLKYIDTFKTNLRKYIYTAYTPCILETKAYRKQRSMIALPGFDSLPEEEYYNRFKYVYQNFPSITMPIETYLYLLSDAIPHIVKDLTPL